MSRLRHTQSARASRTALGMPWPPTGRACREPRRRWFPSARLCLAGLALSWSWGQGLPSHGLWAGEAASLDEARLPPPAARPVDYERDIKPLFESTCFRCHGAERPKSKFRLDNRASALAGGENGVDIHPGRSGQSPLVHYVARLVKDMGMPPEGRGDPLTQEQVGLLRAWIDQGANYPASAATVTNRSFFSATPLVGWLSVSGNTRKFREHWWTREGAAGGLETFQWQEPLGPGAKFTAEGRALADAQDYRVKIGFDKDDLGFVRAGFEHFRKWSDDAGGYYAPFQAPAFRLDRDLHLDMTRAWIETGLTVPSVPRLTLGYEYQARQGTKSTLEWGFVSNPAGGDPKGVYPAFKDVDERLHRVKFDLSHDLHGFLLEDNFRGDFYDLRTHRYNTDSFTLGQRLADSLTRYTESYNHFQAANTFRVEKPVQEWLLLSGGYLYSRLDAEAAFSAETFIPSDPTIGPFAGDLSDQILLRQQSHVFNVNAHLGPWQGLSFTAGSQTDWTRQEGLGHAEIGGFPAPVQANLDRLTTAEQFALRYTRIPFTVLYAEARLQQESLGQFEQNRVDDNSSDERDFMRNTDARADLQDYRAGLNVSPWQQVSLHASYRKRLNRTDYDHRLDTDGGRLPGNAYPAFIRGRKIDTDEAEAKLVLHPARWLKTTLKYQWVATTFDTATDAAIDQGSGTLIPAGRIQAGDYRAHVYSLSPTFMPWRRLYLTATLSYSDSRVISGANNFTTVVPYRGDIYTVLSSATFVFTDKTDLRGSYSFSRADYAQNNTAQGLPLGLAYDRHAVMAGLTHRFNKNLSASLAYAFFRYSEPTAAHANDYTAHGVFASLTSVLP